MDIGKIQETEIIKEMQKSYLDYAMSVIVSRALPDVRDGLKPVHRRILYAMNLMGLYPGKSYSKSAKIVGEVLGKYHPHGDLPVYEALVRLAQDFSMRYTLVQGQGNFGSIDGDSPAAMRYTEARMAKLAPLMLQDIQKDTVDFIENFDSTLKEPIYLPAVLPNLLLMGAEGIAVGMATKIPPHNLREVISGIIAAIKKGKVISEVKEQKKEADFVLNKINLVASGSSKDLTEKEVTPNTIGFETNITVDELMTHIPGPDFPTGGAIYGADGIKDVYSTGRGKMIVRGVAEIVEGRRGKQQIVISELPYQVNKAKLVIRVAELVKEKKLKGISDLRDESDKDGMRVVIELKRDARPKAILNNIYKQTRLQTSFPANVVALVEGTPYTLNLKQIITEYVKHRQKVIVRRTIFELTEAKKRAHILEGLKIALDNLDAVIKTIRSSRTQDDAKKNLIKKFKLTEIQSTAILDMQLRRLAALEREKIEKEYNNIMKLIDRLTAILRDPKRVLGIIKKELVDIKEKYGDARRTKIYKSSINEFSEEDLVAKKDTLITVTKTGYIKRVPQGTYRSQRRGGKGVVGMTTKNEDEIKLFLSATTHDTVLFFTDKGKVYGTKAWEINETSRQAKGQAIVNILNIDQGEKIKSILAVNADKKSQHLIMATRDGIVKKTSLRQFANMRTSGLIAIRLRGNDIVVSVQETSGEDHVLLISQNGKSIRFPEANARPMGRATTGVRGIKLETGDKLIAMEVFRAKTKTPTDKRRKSFRDILSVSEKGLGKRTRLDLFPIQKRGGKGVKVATLSDKTGKLTSARMITEKKQIIIISSKSGQVIKLPTKNIPQLGRATQGVILMRFAKKDDSVAAVAALEKTLD